MEKICDHFKRTFMNREITLSWCQKLKKHIAVDGSTCVECNFNTNIEPGKPDDALQEIIKSIEELKKSKKNKV